MVALNTLVVAFLLLLGINASSHWQHYHYKTLAWQGCVGVLGKNVLLFPRKDKVGYCNVKNQPALGTIAHCIRMLPHHAEQAEQDFIKSCSKYNLTEAKFNDAYENATSFLITNPKKNDPNFNISVPYNRPVKLTQTQVDSGYYSNTNRFINYNYAFWYGIALMCYWFALMFLSGINNLIYFLFPGLVKSFTGPVVNFMRRHIFMPALFKKTHAHHKNLGKWLVWIVPSRWESIMVFVWVALAIIFNCVGFTHNPNNYIWPVQSNEMGRKIADRSGIMVMFLIPQLILFAGRNNFMQWLSGWPYSRFIYVHKWIARISVILFVVHAIGMTYNAGGFHGAKYLARNAKAYVQWGYVSTVAAAIMCFQGLFAIRRLNYEVFLIIHQVLAVFFVIGGWIHCEDQGYEQWFYAATAIWCFDRFVRFVRLGFFGIRPAEVQLIANETVKVTVTRPRYWKPFPGCHAFIHFLRPTCFWQSHPFTIVDQVQDNKTNTITFYLKVKGGVTHGLYKYLARQPENKATIRVAVEGPYGNRLPLDRFDTAVFLTGGNGIPGLYYQARDIVKNNSTKTRVKFYWVIRHYRSIEWFYEELLKLENTSIEPIIYVTQPHVGLLNPIVSQISSSSEFETDEKLDKDSKETKTNSAEEESESYIYSLRKKLHFIEFREGRPDIRRVIAEEISEANGSIAFTTCCHGTMADDARKTVVDYLDTTSHRIELYEQVQSW